jgi:hypothetical protein
MDPGNYEEDNHPDDNDLEPSPLNSPFGSPNDPVQEWGDSRSLDTSTASVSSVSGSNFPGTKCPLQKFCVVCRYSIFHRYLNHAIQL